jgi:pimeloyl-ACP methyl ester carboxylesterase
MADELVAAASAESLGTFAIAGWSLGSPAGTPAQTSLVATIDVRADLSRVSVPTLVISTTEDRLVSPALHRQLAEAIPGAAYAELPTGHLVYQEQPAEWARMITTFIDAQ